MQPSWMKQWQVKYHGDKTTLRLASSYLAIIMALSIGFSFVFYRESIQALEHQLSVASFFNRGLTLLSNGYTVNDYLQARIAEAESTLLGRLILLNLLALLAGSALSYYLARRSLAPIEAAMEGQSRFVSDASHELRTPLTAIRTRNEVALRKPKLSVDDAKEVIKSNIEEVVRLETLAEGLLKLARNDGSFSMAVVPLNDIVSRAINNVLEAAQVKKMIIEDKVPKILVWGDEASLLQVVTVLLDNAIKYSSGRKTIHLQAEVKGRYARLSVRDEGMGIRATDLPHIFERFFRADSSRAHQITPGYGLGLSIAHQIVRKHSGEITVDSALGKGSTFSVKLPLAELLNDRS